MRERERERVNRAVSSNNVIASIAKQDNQIRFLRIGLIAVSIIAVSAIIFSFITKSVDSASSVGTCLPIEKGGTGACSIEDAKTNLGINSNNSIETAYPIGSVYISITNTNPSETLGFGSWEQFGSGRTIVGYNSGNSLFNSSEKTGGNANLVVPYHNHGFTGNALPGHTHTLSTFLMDGWAGSTTAGFGVSGAASAGSADAQWVSAGTPSGTVSYAGISGNATNANYQPFITVFMWKRTN